MLGEVGSRLLRAREVAQVDPIERPHLLADPPAPGLRAGAVGVDLERDVLRRCRLVLEPIECRLEVPDGLLARGALGDGARPIAHQRNRGRFALNRPYDLRRVIADAVPHRIVALGQAKPLERSTVTDGRIEVGPADHSLLQSLVFRRSQGLAQALLRNLPVEQVGREAAQGADGVDPVLQLPSRLRLRRHLVAGGVNECHNPRARALVEQSLIVGLRPRLRQWGRGDIDGPGIAQPLRVVLAGPLKPLAEVLDAGGTPGNVARCRRSGRRLGGFGRLRCSQIVGRGQIVGRAETGRRRFYRVG